MFRFSWTLKDITKGVLLAAFVMLAYKRGHYRGTFIPSPFQILFVVALLLTLLLAIKNYSLKNFFASFPKKMTVAVAGVFFSILVGWLIGTTLGIPTTIATIRDFGTFTISLFLVFLTLFYSKGDARYGRWYLYALFIPNLFMFVFFFTHGFVGYWGVANDGSLAGLIDPNVFSKTLLIPVLFFITSAVVAFKNNKLKSLTLFGLIGALYAMLIYWTASRGSILSMMIGSLAVWALVSFNSFTWRKCIGSGLVICSILFLGYAIVPSGTKQEIYQKIIHTGTVSHSTKWSLAAIVKNPTVTVGELNNTPRTDMRIYEWYYFLRYALRHPFGVGPSASSVNYQHGDRLVQLRPGNTYIELWLWGGMVALGSFVYLLWLAFRTLFQIWKSSMSTGALFLIASLSALSIAIIFDASLYFYWYFIVLGLAFSPYAYAIP